MPVVVPSGGRAVPTTTVISFVRQSAMDLRLYDTLTREKRPFEPLDPARVRMYVCGPTVYDFAHIGNARPVIVFDVLFRLLRHLYGVEAVTYARNITDVDDKINARAAEEYPRLPLNEAIRTVTEKTEQQFHADVDALGCLRPTVEPRATEHIDEMRMLIERLVAAGNAYVAEGHVLFSVPSMPDYGRLSKRPLDEMIAGARVDVAPYKRDPMDFVLWKPSKPGEPAWPSPSGIQVPGRPGWHIECSAMSWKHLGETFDIHWTLKRLEEAAERLSLFRARSIDDPAVPPSAAVLDALCDDLNTPQVITELNSLFERKQAAVLGASCKFLGLDVAAVDLGTMLREKRADLDVGAVDTLIAARNAARKDKNFKESDRIRDELAAMGVVLKDSKDGTTWEIAR
jgi:cysteinyl-tRNA synthetase